MVVYRFCVCLGWYWRILVLVVFSLVVVIVGGCFGGCGVIMVWIVVVVVGCLVVIGLGLFVGSIRLVGDGVRCWYSGYWFVWIIVYVCRFVVWCWVCVVGFSLVG